MKIRIIDCVYKLRPDVTWKDKKVNGFDLTFIAKTYQSSQPLPTLAECEAVWPEIEAEHAAIKQRKIDIMAEQESSGIKGISVQQAKKIVSDKFSAVRAESTNTAKIDALIDACEWIDKKLITQLLK